jgi:anti-sigma factor RsiW
MKRPSESELHALVDGRLTPERAAELAIWLQENSEDAVLVEAWQAQRDALRNAYDRYAQAPDPDRVQQMLAASDRQRRWLPRLPRLAAVLTWITLGALLGFLARGALPPDAADGLAALPRNAAIAHVVYAPEVRHPVEVGAEQEAHLVQWLSKRLGGKLAAPNLQGAGYRLVGGRLLPAAGGPAAQFMYEDQNGLRLTLYVRSHAGQDATAFRFMHEGGVGVFYWIDGGFGYALSGQLERDALLRVANLAYPQLGAR